MIGVCDFCNQDNRKIKYLYEGGIVPVLTVCRYGCDNPRSKPSATNRKRPFEILHIERVEIGHMDSAWHVAVKDERGRVKQFRLKRRDYETEENLRNELTQIENTKQIHRLNLDIHYD